MISLKMGTLAFTKGLVKCKLRSPSYAFMSKVEERGENREMRIWWVWRIWLSGWRLMECCLWDGDLTLDVSKTWESIRNARLLLLALWEAVVSKTWVFRPTQSASQLTQNPLSLTSYLKLLSKVHDGIKNRHSKGFGRQGEDDERWHFESNEETKGE